MPLDLRDLEDEKKRLNALIERAKDALGAIDKLIRMQEIDSLSENDTVSGEITHLNRD